MQGKIRLYNTLSREKDPLPDQKKFHVFVCGPTVYDYAHIGHARTYLFFDFFVKYLRAQGLDVHYLQNITDIDDKIIKRAAEEGKKPEEVARTFTDAYLADMRALGVDAVTEYAPATKFVTQIIAQVERLIEKGFAYKIEGDGWYFDVAKDPDYGKLSGRTAAQAEDSVSRIDDASAKRGKADFCLWKFSKPGEPAWSAPSLGRGRPGWHIEDTAITEFYFGPQYEIHGGGVDIKFPHHEAEIAQQESASGKKPFVQIWMHVGSLLVEGKKMSKSLGNFITIRDFLKNHSAEVLRWITLTHQYRSPMDYSDALVAQAEKSMDLIKEFRAKIAFAKHGAGEMGSSHETVSHEIKTAHQECMNHLADDLNTPAALATIFTTIARFQDQIWQLGRPDIHAIEQYLDGALGLLQLSLKINEIPGKAVKLAHEREESRTNKQFAHADALRSEINALGYEIEDTPRGPFLWPRPKNHN